jgi:hypothetical protein
MWHFTCLPHTVYDFFYPFKPLFRCTQARHLVIFCWLEVAIICAPGFGTLKGAYGYTRSGKGDPDEDPSVSAHAAGERRGPDATEMAAKQSGCRVWANPRRRVGHD